MAYTRRQWKGNVKALLHFDYRYPGEIGDGLFDEIGIETWSRIGVPKWVGTEAPVDQVVVGTPMFGWRCPQFSGAACYIKGANTQNIWNLSSDGKYEMEFFARFTDSAASNILALRNVSGDLLALAKNTSNQMTLTSSFWGVNKVSVKALKTGFWHHIVIRILNNEIKIYLDGEEVILNALPAGEVLDVTETRLGGFAGQMDEFVLRHSAKLSPPIVPTEPYKAYVDMRLLGGAGDGSWGDVSFSGGTTQINTYGMISAVGANGMDMTIGVSNNGVYGAFTRGQEVMVHVSAKKGAEEACLGKYEFKKIVDYRGTVLVLDSAVSGEFVLDAALVSKYYVQIISVPNFRNMETEAAAVITPMQWNTSTGGGIVAFRCQKNFNHKGKILTTGKMTERTDSILMCHAETVNRFLVGDGGGVFAVVGGSITTTDTARIGGDQPGSIKGGTITDLGGGAGYGGGGGKGAGAGGKFLAGGQVGENGTLGNGGIGGRGAIADERGYGWCPGAGGSPGKRAKESAVYAGQLSTTKTSPNTGGRAGAVILVFAATISLSQASVSSGGNKGPDGTTATATSSAGNLNWYDDAGASGGGTGFAYIATTTLGSEPTQITKPQTIRWQIDTVVFDYSGSVSSKTDIDLSDVDTVEGFGVAGTQPLGTDCRIAILANNVWCKITGFEAGSLTPLATQSITTESILTEGNTVEELKRFTSLPEFAGKKIRLAVALWAEIPENAPTIKLALKCKNANNQYTKTLTSEMYPFAQESEITAITSKFEIKDGGTLELLAKIRKADGSESDWNTISAHKGQLALGIQYKATFSVGTIGTAYAYLSGIATEYSPASGIVGAGTVDIISVTENWNIPLASVRMSVRHKRLQDSVLTGYVAFRTLPTSVIGETVGIGTGELGSYDLQNKSGIHQDTVKIYYDSTRQYSGVEVNAASGRVHCTAPIGSVVTVDYEYGWNQETWEPLTNTGTGTRQGINYDTTEFRYTRPISAPPASICATKICMETVSGTSEGEELGTGTGQIRTYLLAHIAKAGTMDLRVDDIVLPASAWLLAEDGKSVRVSAAKKAVITADYDWISETPIVYQFVSLFAE